MPKMLDDLRHFVRGRRGAALWLNKQARRRGHAIRTPRSMGLV
jgi:hypothetical protein